LVTVAIRAAAPTLALPVHRIGVRLFSQPKPG
jgi:hypothetical protein